MKKTVVLTLLLALTGCSSAYWYDDHGMRHHRDFRRHEERRESGERRDNDKRGHEGGREQERRGGER